MDLFRAASRHRPHRCRGGRPPALGARGGGVPGRQRDARVRCRDPRRRDHLGAARVHRDRARDLPRACRHRRRGEASAWFPSRRLLEDPLMRTVDRIRSARPPIRCSTPPRTSNAGPSGWRTIAGCGSSSGARTVAGGCEMAAVRPFGPFAWPVWWESEMWIDPASARSPVPARPRHHHGMDVVWSVVPRGPQETEVTIVHTWAGPAWPLIRVPAADWVIGPVFVHGIASRTLAGLARVVEAAQWLSRAAWSSPASAPSRRSASGSRGSGRGSRAPAVRGPHDHAVRSRPVPHPHRRAGGRLPRLGPYRGAEGAPDRPLRAVQRGRDPDGAARTRSSTSRGRTATASAS